MPDTSGDQKIYGNTSLFILPGKKYSVKQNGLATYDVSYWMQLTEGQEIPFTQGDSPYNNEFPDVVLLYFDIVTDGSICGGIRIDLHYEGKADQRYTKQTVSDDVTIQYDQNQDDILAHPDFIKFAGTPTDRKHNAQFDGQGKFSFFPSVLDDGTTPNPYAGITTYIAPVPSGSLSRIETSWPSDEELTKIGKIFDPTSLTTNFPTLPSGTAGVPRNWLYASYRGRNIANTYYDTERHFLGSGPRPINKGIYLLPPDFT